MRALETGESLQKEKYVRLVTRKAEPTLYQELQGLTTKLTEGDCLFVRYQTEIPGHVVITLTGFSLQSCGAHRLMPLRGTNKSKILHFLSVCLPNLEEAAGYGCVTIRKQGGDISATVDYAPLPAGELRRAILWRHNTRVSPENTHLCTHTHQ